MRSTEQKTIARRARAYSAENSLDSKSLSGTGHPSFRPPPSRASDARKDPERQVKQPLCAGVALPPKPGYQFAAPATVPRTPPAAKKEHFHREKTIGVTTDSAEEAGKNYC